MNCEIENHRGDSIDLLDPLEQEARRINRMLNDGCPDRASQALREDAMSLHNPRAFHDLVVRVSELNANQRYGDRLQINQRGELSVEDRRGCLYGTGVDAYGHLVRQLRQICPREPEFRIDRGGCFPRMELRINPRLEDWRPDPRLGMPRMEPRLDPRHFPPHVVPNYRDLMRNVPMPGSLPIPGLGLPLPGDLMRNLPRPGHGLPNLRDIVPGLPLPGDLMRNLPRPGHGLPSLPDIAPGLPLPGASSSDGRQHILPKRSQPMPG